MSPLARGLLFLLNAGLAAVNVYMFAERGNSANAAAAVLVALVAIHVSIPAPRRDAC